jgi:outer membrane protein
MKKTTLFLSVLAVVAGIATLNSCQTTAPATEANNEEKTDNSAPKGSIVYFNLDRVINEYDMANDLGSVLQSKLQSIDQEVTRRGNKLQSDVNAFQEKIDKGLMTRSVAEVQSQKLQKQQADFQNYAAQKQQEINEEQSVMMNQIADAIKTFVDKYTEEQGFAMVLTTQGDILPAPVVAGSADLDITQAIIDGLNAEYVKEKAKTEKK